MSSLQIAALVAVTVFTLASFFFALAETALLSLGEWRVRQFANDSHPSAGRVVRLLKNPAELVATLAFGSTIANSLLVTVTLLLALSGQWFSYLLIVVLLPGVLIGCEVIPKTLAVRSPDAWALRVATPVLSFHVLTSPLRRVAQAITSFAVRKLVPATVRPTRGMTDDEYGELIELAFQQGTIARTEKDIILEIIRLDQRTVREVMRPRTQMLALPDDLPVPEMIEAVRRHRHRRLEMTERDGREKRIKY
jgi:CBS domain containing-hemolysin-like protein